jgi:toxin ParE1/3/4
MRTWTVRITATAQDDFRRILVWTAEQFGPRQATAYARTLSNAITALGAGPKIFGVKSRDEIIKGLFTLHVARSGRKGRHFLLFRIGTDKDRQVIEILRVLHDVMDLQLHVHVVTRSEE